MESLEKKVLEFIVRHRLCPPGIRVLLACSGGADSLALLEIMHRLAGALEIYPGVIAVDHRQQPGFSQAAKLLQRRCRHHGLPFLLWELAGAAAGESETTLRQRRYRLLADIAREDGWQLVATGHTLDDQIETALTRLLRGTGVEGLRAMAPRREQFIRPLLSCSREEIIAYLKRRRLRWWEDPANDDLRFPRNRVRHRLLPLLEREFNPAVRQAVLRLINSAARQRNLLVELTRHVPLEKAGDRCVVPLDTLRALHPALQAHLLRRMAAEVHPQAAGLLEERVEEVLRRLAAGEKSFSASLGGKRQCLARQGKLAVFGQAPAPAAFFYNVERPGELPIAETGQRLVFALLSTRRNLPAADKHRAYFDAAEVSFPLQVRSPRPGDRLEPWGQASSHKVFRLLMEEKIPRADRWRVPLVLCGEKILWAAGVRRSRHAPITARTRKLLSLQLLPG